ncbi:MAG: Acylamidase [Pseudomonas citronellolis]|nr:MAG: Acylamidase [Pseudomonas citronellolis]
MPIDYHLLSIEALLEGYASQRFTPLDVLQALLPRVDALDPRLNSLCERQDEQALAQARAATARWAKGQPKGRLDGVPLIIKDNTDIHGWTTRNGSRALADATPANADASLVAQLRQAGAIFIGKSTLPEFGTTPLTVSPLTGITRNPWNLAVHAGGSSGGSTAAVAAGFAPAAMGNDAAGSVRTPASFCGVIGFKPSHGLISGYPNIDPGGMVAEGPIARHVRDIALLMEHLCDYEPREPFAWPHPSPRYLHNIEDGVAGLRIAFSPDLGYAAYVNPQIAACCRAAALSLREAGATVLETSPALGNPATGYDQSWPVEVACGLESEVPTERHALVGEFIRDAHAKAQQLSALDYACAVEDRNRVAKALHAFLLDYDLLLTPTAVVAPFAVERVTPPDWPAHAPVMWQPTTFPFNFSRQPALSLPCGFTDDGLPVGLQISARFGRDDLVLRTARALEKCLPMHAFAQPSALHDEVDNA